MINKLLYTCLLLCIGTMCGYGQTVAVKTNAFYTATTRLTPNLGAEIGLGGKTTLDLSVGYNPWNRRPSIDDESNKKAVHLLISPELRYWLCQSFNGHFFGFHALFAHYNISQLNVPLLFGKDSEKYRHEGYAYGAGLSYGYQFLLGKRWNLELSAGVGYARLNYTKYECVVCGEKIKDESRNYFGPTRAAVSLIFIIK